MTCRDPSIQNGYEIQVPNAPNVSEFNGSGEQHHHPSTQSITNQRELLLYWIEFSGGQTEQNVRHMRRKENPTHRLPMKRLGPRQSMQHSIRKMIYSIDRASQQWFNSLCSIETGDSNSIKCGRSGIGSICGHIFFVCFFFTLILCTQFFCINLSSTSGIKMHKSLVFISSISFSSRSPLFN